MRKRSDSQLMADKALEIDYFAMKAARAGLRGALKAIGRHEFLKAETLIEAAITQLSNALNDGQ